MKKKRKLEFLVIDYQISLFCYCVLNHTKIAWKIMNYKRNAESNIGNLIANKIGSKISITNNGYSKFSKKDKYRDMMDCCQIEKDLAAFIFQHPDMI